MKFTSVIFASASLLASFVAAQDLSQLPPCAVSCATTGITGQQTGCQGADIACICRSTNFINSISSCVVKACSAADLQKTISFAAGLCTQAGVSLDVSSIAAQATAGTASGTATSPATVAQATTTTGTATVTSRASTTTGGTGTSSSAAPTSSNIAGLNGVNMGLGALVGAAVVLAL